jgi:hypothetical protein
MDTPVPGDEHRRDQVCVAAAGGGHEGEPGQAQGEQDPTQHVKLIVALQQQSG